MVWLIFFSMNQPLTWASCKHRLSVQLRSGHVSSAPADWAQSTFWEKERRQFEVYYCLGKEKDNKVFMFSLWERNSLLAWGVDIRNWNAWLFAYLFKTWKNLNASKTMPALMSHFLSSCFKSVWVKGISAWMWPLAGYHTLCREEILKVVSSWCRGLGERGWNCWAAAAPEPVRDWRVVMDVQELRDPGVNESAAGAGAVKQGFSLEFLLILGQHDALLRGSK